MKTANQAKVTLELTTQVRRDQKYAEAALEFERDAFLEDEADALYLGSLYEWEYARAQDKASA